MKQNFIYKTKHRSAWLTLALLFMSVISMTAQTKGERFQVGTLWYEITDVAEQTVKVTYANDKAAKTEARQQNCGADYLDEGDKAYKGYNGTLNETITIPEQVNYQGKDWTVTAIGTCAFINERGFYVEDKVKNKEKRIRLDFVLPPTIKHIEEAAFYQAYACTINFPEGLKTIEKHAFYKSIVGYYYTYRRPDLRRGYRRHTTGTITIPGQTAIGPQAFEECPVSGAKLSCPNIKYLGYQAFKGSKFSMEVPASANLGQQPTDQEIIDMYANFPADTNKESGAEAFAGFQGTVTLQEDITTIPTGMFEGAFTNLAQFYIPLSVTTIEERAFANASILSFNDLSVVTKIGARAFENSVLSGDFVILENVEEIGNGAFKGNVKLTGFTLKGSTNCTVGAGIVEGCPNLEYLDLRNVKNENFKKNLKNLSREFNSGTITAGLPTNTIVYLPDATGITFAEGQDVNFVKNDGTCTKLLLEDGVEYEFPYAINANEVVYNRDFSSFADGKNCFTIFLPYAVTLKPGIRAYNLDLMKKVTTQVDQWTKKDTEYYVFKSIPDGSTLEANRAYLLRITDGKIHTSQDFTAIGNTVTIAASGNDRYERNGRLKPKLNTEATTSDQSYYFTGSTEKIPRDNEYTATIYHPWTLGRDENGNDIWKRMTESKGSDMTGKLIPPFRGIIMPKSGISAAKQFVLLSEEEATGISDLTNDADAQQGAQRIYTTDGRYVGTNFDSLPSGMYIVKGKKTLKTK